MRVKEALYSNSEYKVTAEKLHTMRYDREMLELSLDEEEFKYKYIKKRKDETVSGISARLVLNFPIMFIAANILVLLIDLIINSVQIKGFVVFAGLFLCVLTGVLVYRYKRDVNSKLIIERSVIDKIGRLKTQIKSLDNAIEKMTEKKKMLEMEYRDDTPETPEIETEKNTTAVFKIKKQLDEDELIKEQKRKEAEIAMLNNSIDELKKQEKEIKYKILSIDYDYQIVSDSIFKFFSVLVTMVVAQPIFGGIMKHVIPIIYIIISLVYFFYLVNICKEPFIMYQVEHKKKMIQDYAFCNNLFPMSDKLKEVEEEIECCIRQINYIKKDEL